MFGDLDFAAGAPGLVEKYLQDGDQAAARAIVHRIRDELGLLALLEIVKPLGWRDPLADWIIETAGLRPHEADIFRAQRIAHDNLCQFERAPQEWRDEYFRERRQRDWDRALVFKPSSVGTRAAPF